jgi:hypothetical protein
MTEPYPGDLADHEHQDDDSPAEVDLPDEAFDSDAPPAQDDPEP